MTTIAILRKDDGVSILHTIDHDGANNGFTVLEDESDADAIKREVAKWSAVHDGQYVSHRVIEASEIPQDRTFRSAWGMKDKAIAVDMPKAREIHRANLRALRAPLFSDLDIQLQDVLVSGDKKAQSDIVARKKVLRDITEHADIAAASTPAALKAAAVVALTNSRADVAAPKAK